MVNLARVVRTSLTSFSPHRYLSLSLSSPSQPVGGRNFESFGEDPHLAAEMAFMSTLGMQSKGVMGCVKHWVFNNQGLVFFSPHIRSDINRFLTQSTIVIPSLRMFSHALNGSSTTPLSKVPSLLVWAL